MFLEALFGFPFQLKELCLEAGAVEQKCNLKLKESVAENQKTKRVAHQS